MADTLTNQQRGTHPEFNEQLGYMAQCSAQVSPWRMLAVSAATGTVAHAAADSTTAVGCTGDEGALILEKTCVRRGPCTLLADAPVVYGQSLKCGTNGVLPFVDSTLAGATVKTVAAGGDYGNQPANDSITIVSDAAGDTTQVVTIYGTTNGTDTVVYATTTLNGITARDSSNAAHFAINGGATAAKTDWGVILGFTLSASCAGTVTLKEKSGGLTITTVATGTLTSGVVATTAPNAYNRIPTIVAGGASTKQIGLIGTNAAGTTIYDSQALDGTTVTAVNSAFRTITYVLYGDLAAASAATVAISTTVDSPDLKIGKALESQASAGKTVFAWVL